MAYNITWMDSANNILDIANGINTSSNSVLAYTILVMIWVITFITMKQFDTKIVFLVSSFSTSLIAVFMLAMGWIPMAILFIPLIFTMFALVGFWWNKD